MRTPDCHNSLCWGVVLLPSRSRQSAHPSIASVADSWWMDVIAVTARCNRKAQGLSFFAFPTSLPLYVYSYHRFGRVCQALSCGHPCNCCICIDFKYKFIGLFLLQENKYHLEVVFTYLLPLVVSSCKRRKNCYIASAICGLLRYPQKTS